jgi:hypothetical protein
VFQTIRHHLTENCENGGNRFLRNVGVSVPDYKASAHRKLRKIEATYSSETLVSLFQTIRHHLTENCGK